MMWLTSNNSAWPTVIAPVDCGEAVVISVKDRSKQGRVRLHFGAWASPRYVYADGQLRVPTLGAKVKYYYYENPKRFTYDVIK